MTLRLRVTPNIGRGASRVLADRDWTVSEVKDAIAHVMNIPRAGQRLWYRNHEMRDNQTLEEWVPNGYTADLWLKVPTDDQNEWMEKVKEDWTSLKDAPDDVRSDAEVVAAALRQDGRALQFATDELRLDRELVLQAVQQQPMSLRFAGVDLRSDMDVVLAAVQADVGALQFAGAPILSNRDFMLVAVEQHGSLLQYASEELRGDKELVLTAVREDGKALQFASDDLQDTREVVLAAASDDGMALLFASDRLRDDRDIAKRAVKRGGVSALQAVGDALRCDPEIIRIANSSVTQRRLGPSGSTPLALAGGSGGASQEDDTISVYSATTRASASAAPAPSDPSAVKEVNSKERLDIATHWRLEGFPPRLVHRWKTGVALTAPPPCANCIVGRHLFCRACGPKAMLEAKTVMSRIKAEDRPYFEEERRTVQTALGAGLYYGQADLQASAFKGIN